MNRKQIESQSKLIEACRMLGAKFRSDRIIFASGLEAKLEVGKQTFRLTHPVSERFIDLKNEETAHALYRGMLLFLHHADIPY